MQYSAINIQGNIISGEVLEKIRTEDAKFHQSAADFGLNRNTSVRDEIGIAWAAARAHWSAFKMRRERLSDGDSGTSETRQGWMIPFLRELGYELEKSTAEFINGKTYAISHRAVNRDDFPVHIAGINQSLDRRPETGGIRLSPHALLQEYLNNHEHLYALITNGQYIRLLRDATRLSRLSYLEFNIERMMEEELFAEFALLFRVIHATRMPLTKDAGEDAFMEKYHQEALSSGSRIREKLSEAVESSLKLLANGLLKHPANNRLRELALDGTLKPAPFYLYLLRLVYRMLFLMVIEERQLIYPDKRDEATSKLKDLYYRFYSINRLTRLAERMIYIDPKKTDLWQSLVTTFRLFESGEFGEKLGIKPLGSGLFEPGALGNLMTQSLDNGTLLKVLQMLVTFENENRQRARVNYADLDVEEFGSVYEGLLEYDASLTEVNGQPVFSFVTGDARSRSGSHYTPEELVKPLIKHSLDYLIEDRLKEPEKYTNQNQGAQIFSPHRGETPEGQRGELRTQQSLRETALLSLRICDVACGSGHILLSAARRVAHELACLRENAEQPSPPYFRAAMRDVIKNCIYGVDKNPLAVELCKVALWLESHNPGEPLGFLDHHIKCGDSIVGLAHRDELENGIADEAFKTLPYDDKEIAAALLKNNKQERKLRLDKQAAAQLKITDAIDNTVQESMAEYRTFNRLPERTPDEIAAKAHAYKKLMNGKGYGFLKAMADTQVAQFFIPKITANKEKLMTDGEFMTILQGFDNWQNPKSAFAKPIASQRNFFHWFLEFPEVFQNDGFDCILGNPPFLGGSKITGLMGDDYFNYLKMNFFPAGGLCDLVGFFYRRNFSIIKREGFLSLISTNTISQGDTRRGSLDYILDNKGKIIHVVRSVKWPGVANLFVSLNTIYKGDKNYKMLIDNRIVNYISSYFDEAELLQPQILIWNQNKIYLGCKFLGEGFILNEGERNNLISKDIQNQDVIYPLINGKDINDSPSLKYERFIINFFEWDFGRAALYTDIMQIVQERVKPERLKNNDKLARERWWNYLRPRRELYSKIKGKSSCFAIAKVTKYLALTLTPTDVVYTDNVFVLIENSFYYFSILSVTFFEEWARKYSSSLANTLNFAPTDCFENFPFPQNLSKEQEQKLEILGETYHEHRRQLMLKMQLGLTKTYNAFHAKEIKEGISTQDLENQDKKAIEKRYGKEVWNLWNHLQKTPNTCSFDEAVTGILQLRRRHVEMDNTVLEAYGWNTPSPAGRAGVGLSHNFYEVDYLPENDRVRYTIHPDARKEILKRLLELNHKIHDEEVRAGLWDKKKSGKKDYTTKGPLPDVAKEDEGRYGQGRLF